MNLLNFIVVLLSPLVVGMVIATAYVVVNGASRSIERSAYEKIQIASIGAASSSDQYVEHRLEELRVLASVPSIVRLAEESSATDRDSIFLNNLVSSISCIVE